MTLGATYPRLTRQFRKQVSALGGIGDHVLFYAKAIAGTPFAASQYRREIIRLLAGSAWAQALWR